MRYSMIHDCPPGGCQVYYMDENVKLEGLGTLLMQRRFAEKIVAGMIGTRMYIVGDPGYIDDEWYPPVTFPWEDIA